MVNNHSALLEISDYPPVISRISMNLKATQRYSYQKVCIHEHSLNYNIQDEKKMYSGCST